MRRHEPAGPRRPRIRAGAARGRLAAAALAAAAAGALGAAPSPGLAAAPPDWPTEALELLAPSGALAPPSPHPEAPGPASADATAVIAFGCLPGEPCPAVAPAETPDPLAPIPLPAALTLLGAGLATLAMLLRRGDRPAA